MAETVQVSVADAKKRFSELLGRVAYGDVTVVVTRRGRPVARLVRPDASTAPLSSVKGWLEDDDPLFAELARIERDRARQKPRPTAPRSSRRASGRGRR